MKSENLLPLDKKYQKETHDQKKELLSFVMNLFAIISKRNVNLKVFKCKQEIFSEISSQFSFLGLQKSDIS